MTSGGGMIGPVGEVGLQIIKPRAWMPPELEHKLRGVRPQSRLGEIVYDVLKYGLTVEQADELIDALCSTVVVTGSLTLTVIRHPDSPFADPRAGKHLTEEYGLVASKLVTTAGVNYLATQLRNQAIAVLNYHAIGTGTGAEATGDTALGTEWVAGDYTGGARATGTQSNPSANVMRTVGTNTKLSAGTSAVTEHGIFTVATVATATLWDRSVFSAVNLAQNDSLQSTYDGTFAAGG
jgi:hypothetical protein